MIGTVVLILVLMALIFFICAGTVLLIQRPSYTAALQNEIAALELELNAKDALIEEYKHSLQTMRRGVWL